MDITLQEAYAEACRALGEATITQRLLAAEVQRLTDAQTAAPPEA